MDVHWNISSVKEGCRGEEVAAYLQQKLCADLQEADPALSWEGYERIVCVGSIYAGRLAKQLLACIRANTKELAGKSVGMLLCGMSDAAPAMACGYSDIPIYITQTEARRAKRSHCAYHTAASQTPS